MDIARFWTGAKLILEKCSIYILTTANMQRFDPIYFTLKIWGDPDGFL